MRPITKIIIQLVDIESIQALISKHIEDGLPMVGFHYMVESNGDTEIGRPITMIGNHYLGENATSIGIATIDLLLEELEIKGTTEVDVFIVEDGKMRKYK